MEIFLKAPLAALPLYSLHYWYAYLYFAILRTHLSTILKILKNIKKQIHVQLSSKMFSSSFMISADAEQTLQHSLTPYPCILLLFPALRMG